MRFSRSPRFWMPYRAIPLAALGFLLAISIVFSMLPAHFVRSIVCPVSHQDEIIDSAARHGVDPYLVCAVIECESGWHVATTSSAGAQGLMQLMPDTAQELASRGLVDSATYDPTNLLDPATNIEYGCAYLAWLANQLSSQDEVIAAYNAGIANVQQWGSAGYEDLQDVIAYPETSAYLERVVAMEERYRRYYPDGINV